MAVRKPGSNLPEKFPTLEEMEERKKKEEAEKMSVTTAEKVKAEPKKREPKELPAIDFASLTVSVPTADTVRSLRPTRGDRTPEQQQTDKLVEQAHARWVENGKPTKDVFHPNNRQAVLHIQVPNEVREALVYRIRQSAAFLKLKVRFGREAEGQILFCVMDQPKKEEKKTPETSGIVAGSAE